MRAVSLDLESESSSNLVLRIVGGDYNGNSLYANAGDRIVRLRRKTGWFRNFIITPVNRDAFLEELRAKCPRS